MTTYTGEETAITWDGGIPDAWSVFVLRPPSVPGDAIPLVDETTSEVVGFRAGSGGVYRIYDLDGDVVDMYEEPLQTPLFDPIDLIFIAGGLIRAIGKSAAAATGRIAAGGLRGIGAALTKTTVATLRATSKRLFVGELKFTTTTTKHND